MLSLIDRTEASRCLVVSLQVGQVFAAAAHDDVPKQLMYSWRRSGATAIQGEAMPAGQPHSGASTPPLTHLSGQQPPALSSVPETRQLATSAVPHAVPPLSRAPAAPPTAIAASSAAGPSAAGSPAADPHLAERRNPDRKRAADASLSEGPSKRRMSSTFSNSTCGVDSSRSSAMSVSHAPLGAAPSSRAPSSPAPAPHALPPPDCPPAPTSQAPPSAQLHQPAEELPHEEAFRSSAVDSIPPIAPPSQEATPRRKSTTVQYMTSPPVAECLAADPGLRADPGQSADSQGGSGAEARHETAFPQLFGQTASPATRAPPVPSADQSPLLCNQQRAAARNKPASVQDGARGFGALFSSGEPAHAGGDDSCNAFAAGGFTLEDDPSPSAS